jgi:methionyl-tRNA synthetase
MPNACKGAQMSNFTERLTELMEVAKSPTNEIEDWQCRLQDRQAAMQFLYNHAPAIRDLVVAAEELHQRIGNRSLSDHSLSTVALSEALAKLEEA